MVEVTERRTIPQWVSSAQVMATAPRGTGVTRWTWALRAIATAAFLAGASAVVVPAFAAPVPAGMAASSAAAAEVVPSRDAGASTGGTGLGISTGTGTGANANATSASAPDVAPAAVPTATNPALEARMLAITGELRCLVCQNQTIADSHADLAVDLRQEVRELIGKGRSDAEIRRYMTDRYGDFVLYRPPLKPTTWALWLGPALLLLVAAVALVAVIRRRARLPDDRFEPDPGWDDMPGNDTDPLAPPLPAATPTRPGAAA